jgi:hypothetical protein
MPQLIAEADFTYATKPLKVGDEFEASVKDANILKLAKRARDPKPGDRRRSGRYQRRDMVAES